MFWYQMLLTTHLICLANNACSHNLLLGLGNLRISRSFHQFTILIFVESATHSRILTGLIIRFIHKGDGGATRMVNRRWSS